MKITLQASIVTFFYLILVGLIIFSLINIFNSPTAFEEYEVEDDAKLPSFTICPGDVFSDQNEPIESFEGAMQSIENAKQDYLVKLHWMKSFTKR